MTTTEFNQLGLNDSLVETVQQLGYEQPTEIQQLAIPALINGNDILGVSQTGTGKTAAFVLPLLQHIDPSNKEIQILVLTPTRELGIQVAKSFEKYASAVDKFKVACIYGGQDIQIQFKALKKNPQVIVATPGRLIDHLKRRSLKIDQLKTVVLDEADEMLNMGFQEDVEQILETTPKNAQMALFSATMPPAIRRIANDFLKDPVEIKINQQVKTVDNIEQKFLLVKKHDKKEVLERVICTANAEAGIIFVKTRQQTIEISEKLEQFGLMCAPLNGDLQQNMREATIRQLTDGHIDWIIATDVAARGLDVKRISHVINYDLPHDLESYVHRIGRTGRAGRSGTAITLASPPDMRQLRRVEEHTGAPLTRMEVPDGKKVSDLRIDEFKDSLLKVIGQKDLKRTLKLVEKIQEDHELDPKVIAAALALMATESRPLYPKLKNIEEAVERQSYQKDEKGRKRNKAEKTLKDGIRYRISVGKNQRVGAGDIVGAIANEGGIPSSEIGDIKLFQDFSTIELPKSLPEYVVKDLSQIKIKKHSLALRIWKESSTPDRKKFSRDDSRPKKKENFKHGTGKKKIRKLPPRS
jgi:ATP-dependent RNA helicase DeaD